MDRVATACSRIADSRSFQAAVVAVILANAVVIGLETYDSIEQDYGDLLTVLNDVFLGLFTLEIAIRIAAHGRRPQDFFRSGWNVFDFLVVGLAYLPWIRESVTLLRIMRLLRIARLLSVVPGLRVVIVGLSRSIAPIGSVVLLTFFLLYVYGVLGWLLFGDHDPEQFGDIGQALLTLFQVLTLEGWNEVLAKEMELSSWAWVYFVSFVLLATFVVLNVVIAIVVNSIDEAHRIEAEEKRRAEAAAHPELASLHGKVEALKAALDDLEQELSDRASKS
jgi:voltage-gated sodium channel